MDLYIHIYIQVSDKLINSSVQCIGKRGCEDIYCVILDFMAWRTSESDILGMYAFSLVFLRPRRGRIFPTGRYELFAEDGGHGQSAWTVTIKKDVIANPGMSIISRNHVYTHIHIYMRPQEKHASGITYRCKLCTGAALFRGISQCKSVSGYIRWCVLTLNRIGGITARLLVAFVLCRLKL